MDKREVLRQLFSSLAEVKSAYKKLMELWKSGRLMLDLDAIFNMINGGNHKKPEEPKPYKGFWFIIIMLSILLEEVFHEEKGCQAERFFSH